MKATRINPTTGLTATTTGSYTEKKKRAGKEGTP